jgi:hypothetical protein
MSLPFIVNLNQFADASRPVNRGVRHASDKQGSEARVAKPGKANAASNDRINGRSNNSFDASGMGAAFIVNLSLP